MSEPIFELPDAWKQVQEVLRSLQQNIDDMMRPIREAVQSFQETIRPIAEMTSTFKEHFSEFAEVFIKAFRPIAAIAHLGDAQYVYWDYISIDFVDEILQTSNTNKTLRAWLLKEKYISAETTIMKCMESSLLSPYIRIFNQSVEAYHDKHYNLAIVGLFTVIDGVLTDVSGDITTSIYKRADAILTKIEDDRVVDSNEMSILALALTFQKTLESLSTNQCGFDGKCPKNLNRHWIMHGRDQRRKTRLDYVKLINFLYGIILIDEFGRKEV